MRRHKHYRTRTRHPHQHEGANLAKTIASEHRLSLVAVSSFGILGIIGVAMLYPSCYGQASAEDGAIHMSVQAEPVLAVGVTNSVTLNISPTIDGAYDAGIANLSVTTNDSDEYQVFIHTENGESSLRSTTTTGTINPVSGEKTLTELDKNSWGYAFGKGLDTATTLYRAVPTDTTSWVWREDTAETGTAREEYTLAFGAKIDTTLPAGEYSNNVIVSVIAKPMNRDINSITTMQEMKANICENTIEGVSKSLLDTRNNKFYEVFKAKDGNCWMRENLAVDGTIDEYGIKQPTVEKALVAGDVVRDVNGNPELYTLEQGTNYWDGSTLGEDYQSEYGYYYRFDAANAGTDPVVDDSKGITVDELSFMNAEASICPTGGESGANWVLPKTGQKNTAGVSESYTGVGSYAKLLDVYGGRTVEVATGSVLNLQRSGSIYKSVPTGIGLSGGYWTRTVTSEVAAPNMTINDSSVNPGYLWASRLNNESIRCLYPSTSTKEAVQTQ